MSDDMDAPTPADYDAEDGWDDGDGIEQCPHCERDYSPNGGYFGAVYSQSGQEYESIYATEAGTGPYFCQDCYHELETNAKAQSNQSLADFAGGGE